MEKRRVLTLLLLVFFLLPLLRGGPLLAEELTRVRLSEVVRSIFYAPQYVALEKGFFEEEGLSIDLSTAWGADKGAAALISGSVDIGFFGPEAAIYVYQQGAEDYLVGFAQLTARDGSFFMSRELSSDTFSWEDVRGETIVGARRGGVPQMVLEYVLKIHGIQPFEDVEILTNLAFEAAVGAYESGLGAFIAQFEPAMSTVAAHGGGTIVSSLGAEAGPITYTLYHARESYLQANEEVLERFTRAIYRGQQWVDHSSPEEVALVVSPFFPAIEREILVAAIKRYQSIEAWPVTPIICEQGFENLQTIMSEAGELKESVSFHTLMSNTIAKKVVEGSSH